MVKVNHVEEWIYTLIVWTVLIGQENAVDISLHKEGKMEQTKTQISENIKGSEAAFRMVMVVISWADCVFCILFLQSYTLEQTYKHNEYTDPPQVKVETPIPLTVF